MKLNTLFTITAVVSLAYAIGLLLMPAMLLTMYGVTSGPGEQLMAQLFGAELVAVGLVAWFARNITDSSTRQAILLAFLISQFVGVIVTVMGTLSGRFNALGWSSVAIYLFLGLGSAYFRFMKPSAA